MNIEQLLCEVRASGRTVEGIAIPYGETANIGAFRERVEPGAVELREPAVLNDEHRSWEPLAVLTFADGEDALRFRAELPPGVRQDSALARIASGELRGASVEFGVLEEAVEAGVRVVKRALVWGVALARSPLYTETQIETRARAVHNEPDESDPLRGIEWYL